MQASTDSLQLCSQVQPAVMTTAASYGCVVTLHQEWQQRLPAVTNRKLKRKGVDRAAINVQTQVFFAAQVYSD